MITGRYYTLDGMRGLAAIAVVIFHFDNLGITTIKGGYLAVDFFFILSGFVLAVAYEQKFLNNRIGVLDFALLRLIRLYPLYAIGTLFGLIALACGIPLGMPALTPGQFTAAALTGLAMLPDPWSVLSLYPANPPAWSLMFELIVNMVFAVLLVRLRSRYLLVGCLICFALYALKLQHAWVRAPYANLGPYWDQFVGGLLRVTGGFTAGMLLKRVSDPSKRRIDWRSFPAIAVLLATLALEPSLATDILALGVIFPVVIWLGSRFELPARCRHGCEVLGDISYPLYATHFGLLYLFDRGAKAVALPAALEICGFVVLMCAFSLMLVRIDARIRKALSGVFDERFTAAPQAR